MTHWAGWVPFFPSELKLRLYFFSTPWYLPIKDTCPFLLYFLSFPHPFYFLPFSQTISPGQGLTWLGLCPLLAAQFLAGFSCCPFSFIWLSKQSLFPNSSFNPELPLRFYVALNFTPPAALRDAFLSQLLGFNFANACTRGYGFFPFCFVHRAGCCTWLSRPVSKLWHLHFPAVYSYWWRNQKTYPAIPDWALNTQTFQANVSLCLEIPGFALFWCTYTGLPRREWRQCMLHTPHNGIGSAEDKGCLTIDSQNHRMVWVWGDLKAHPVPNPRCGWGCHPPAQAAQGPTQPGLKHFVSNLGMLLFHPWQ